MEMMVMTEDVYPHRFLETGSPCRTILGGTRGGRQGEQEAE